MKGVFKYNILFERLCFMTICKGLPIVNNVTVVVVSKHFFCFLRVYAELLLGSLQFIFIIVLVRKRENNTPYTHLYKNTVFPF